MWYPPRPNDDASVFDEIRPATSFTESKLMVLDETATTCTLDGGSLWKNWHVNDEHCNDMKNNPPVIKDDRLNYLISNNWHLIPKNIASSSRRQYIHGVEVRKLGKDHFLCGEHGLFSTRKFSKFDIIGEYTGMVVGSTVNGHYVAALEDTTHEASLGVDAQKCGNEMRFINSHLNISFSANVTMRTAYVNSYPHILLVCTQDIEPGDELLLVISNMNVLLSFLFTAEY